MCEGAGATRVSPLLPRSDGRADYLGLRRRGEADGQFAATPWRAAGVVATKPLGGWPAFSEPAEQATRTRIWLESRVSIRPGLRAFLTGSCHHPTCAVCPVLSLSLSLIIITIAAAASFSTSSGASVSARPHFPMLNECLEPWIRRSSLWLTWIQEILHVFSFYIQASCLTFPPTYRGHR